jgi:N-acetylmuramoyl-L-alanine amidase
MGSVGRSIMGMGSLPVIAGVSRCVIRAALAVTLALAFNSPTRATENSQANFTASSGRIIADEGRARLVLDFDNEPDYELHYLNHPPRIVIDLPDVHYQFTSDALATRGLFTDVRFGAMGAGRSRIVLTAQKPLQITANSVVEDEASEGYRFILDAELTTDSIFADLIKNQNWTNNNSLTTSSVDDRGDRVVAPSQFIVAIDAGHGGIDAGARGAKSLTDEKTITLEFARQLATSVDKLPGVKAVLTRDADVFLALSERVALARQQGAQLFVSVHADTLSQKDIRGSTVYTLSDRAFDRMAQALADRENRSDQLAGVSVMDAQPEVADILLDLTRRETQVFSTTLADKIIKSFSGKVELINNPHRYAGFQVLRAHDVPSVLLELGFLSNAEDEKLLLDVEWRQKVAELIAKAVGEYKAQAVVNNQ